MQQQLLRTKNVHGRVFIHVQGTARYGMMRLW